MRGLVNVYVGSRATKHDVFSASFIIHFSGVASQFVVFSHFKDNTHTHMHHDVPSTLSSRGETIYLMDILKLAERAHLHAFISLLRELSVELFFGDEKKFTA
jgi:hypothetical protein